ncbi:F-box family protein [Euphorbia peplus]|nr:F-box family protein [Euphorbia peplus]
MDSCFDFLNCLDNDTSLKILSYLDDPFDLLRVPSVSRSWRHFVIENALSKQLCFRKFPCLYKVDHVIESNCGTEDSLEVGCSESVEWENLKREHRVYVFLAHCCSSFPLRACISDAIGASSTDNDPRESIRNTLQLTGLAETRASYWSSKGQSDPAVPETLTYKLVADICVIDEIGVQPFQAFFQGGSPIYSANSVRFRMGYPKTPMNDRIGEPSDNCGNDNFVWTYTSPEFTMAQENRLQKFKLPQPVLCIGGILQVELLGRVQRQYADYLFYICVSHVQVIGRPLLDGFKVEFLDESRGKFVLDAHNYTRQCIPDDSACNMALAHLEGRVRDLQQLMNVLRAQRGL